MKKQVDEIGHKSCITEEIMTNEDLYYLKRVLKKSRFIKAIVTSNITKCKRRLEVFIEDLESATKPLPEYEEFTKKREELAKEYCEKNTDGTPKIKVTPNSMDPDRPIHQYNIPEQGNPDSKYSKELKKVIDEHKAAIDIQEKKVESFNELLKEPTLFEPTMIEWDDIKNEDIPQELMDDIHWVIKK